MSKQNLFYFFSNKIKCFLIKEGVFPPFIGCSAYQKNTPGNILNIIITSLNYFYLLHESSFLFIFIIFLPQKGRERERESLECIHVLYLKYSCSHHLKALIFRVFVMKDALSLWGVQETGSSHVTIFISYQRTFI